MATWRSFVALHSLRSFQLLSFYYILVMCIPTVFLTPPSAVCSSSYFMIRNDKQLPHSH